MLVISLCWVGCSEITIKTMPEFYGTDYRADKLLSDFMSLSTENHVTFTHKVSIGFKRIDQGPVVGLCHDGLYFREITLDTDFWINTTQLGKIALFFHEAAHCYCGRDHDYNGIPYPESESERFGEYIKGIFSKRPGYYPDGCPLSLMFPSVVPDECVRLHYNDYTKEMFQNCKPW
jgi:hypothetical protein